MKYPIVQVDTKDNTTLSGMLLNPQYSKIYLHVHGTGANFYYNSHFLKPLSEKLNQQGWSFLSAGLHSSDIYEVWKDYQTLGSAHEFFENCIQDIDAWINFAIENKYATIVLSGHSLGSEKVVYYMDRGNFREYIKAVILLGFSDSVGDNQRYAKEKLEENLRQAGMMVASGRGDQLMDDLLIHAGYLPQTASSYLNFFSPNSELSTALPLRDGKKLERYNRIKVPILGLIGDTGEFTIIPIEEAIALLKENPLAQVRQIKNCDHEYREQDNKAAEIIVNFIKQVQLIKCS